jgi:hypothetical protein
MVCFVQYESVRICAYSDQRTSTVRNSSYSKYLQCRNIHYMLVSVGSMWEWLPLMLKSICLHHWNPHKKSSPDRFYLSLTSATNRNLSQLYTRSFLLCLPPLSLSYINNRNFRRIYRHICLLSFSVYLSPHKNWNLRRLCTETLSSSPSFCSFLYEIIKQKNHKGYILYMHFHSHSLSLSYRLFPARMYKAISCAETVLEVGPCGPFSPRSLHCPPDRQTHTCLTREICRKGVINSICPRNLCVLLSRNGLLR